MTTTERQQLKSIIQPQREIFTEELVYLKTQLKPINKDYSLNNAYHIGRHQEQNIIFHRFKKYKDDISMERLKLISESAYCIDCMMSWGYRYV